MRQTTIERSDAKGKFKQAVKAYIDMFPDEYAAFIEGIRQKQSDIDNLINPYSEMKNADYIDRALLEYPENLFSIIESSMTPEEFSEFNTKGFSRWIGKEYPQFLISKAV